MLQYRHKDFHIVIFLILFEIGFGITINLIGTISISELIAFLYTIFFISKSDISKNQDLKHILLLYSLLIIFQAISEILVGNSTSNALKGISIPIISFCHTFILVKFFNKNPYFITWALIGIIIRIIIFPSAVEGNTTDALTGEDAAFLKFVIAPLLTNILLVYSIVKNKKNNYILFIGLGIALVILGARSSGVMIFLTGLIAFFINSRKHISSRKLKQYTILILLISYSSYCIYANMVLSGDIKSGNSTQLQNVENPYNPINLLRMGRTETFIGAIAFLDKPLTGWGAWAIDPNAKYHIMASKLTDKAIILNNSKYYIPSHSIIIGTGMQNGIMPLFIILCILFFYLKKGVYCIRNENKYKMIIILFTIMIFWHMLFSPITQLRLMLPLYMAFILTVAQKIRIHNYSINKT